MQSSAITDRRRRSYVTAPGYRRGMKPPNAGRKLPAETYTREEIHRLMSALGRGAAGDRNRAAAVLGWRCGLRASEILELMPHDVDLAAGTVTVRRGKGGKRRVVGIDPEAAAVVQTWLARRRKLGLTARHRMVCTISQPTLGNRMHYSVLRESFRDAGQRAGIEKRMHLHGLRHTYASDCVRDGVPLPFIQKLLGHSSLATTARYLGGLGDWEAIEAARGRTWRPLPGAAVDPRGPVTPADVPVLTPDQLRELAERLWALAGVGGALPRPPAEIRGRAAVGLEAVLDRALKPPSGIAGANLKV